MVYAVVPGATGTVVAGVGEFSVPELTGTETTGVAGLDGVPDSTGVETG